MARTEREQAILDQWPVVTAEDIEKMNDEFPHYIFYRRTALCGVRLTTFFTSCCGKKVEIPEVRRTEWPFENELLDACRHNEEHICPWCGRRVTMKDLGKAGKRKGLKTYRLALLLHAKGDELYADALSLRKSYETDADLTAKPEYWLSSGYRFAIGEVMEIDYQVYERRKGFITWERGSLGRMKRVQEPFKVGSISSYHHESYAILNQTVLEKTPMRYCQYFGGWLRGNYIHYSCSFVSYLTAYCIYPRQIEMLMKAGLRQPVEELVCNRKKFARAINWEEPDIREAMDLSKAELKQVVAIQPDFGALECRAYAKRHFGVNWTVSESVDYWNMWGLSSIQMGVLRFARKYHLPINRLLDYLCKNQVVDPDLPWLDLDDVFEMYKDYLDAAYYLGWCLEHSAVLWPKNLKSAHDDATDQKAKLQLAELEKAERRHVAVSAKERKAKYEFELDGLKIVFPMTAAAIKREGKELSHCVGGYAERHMKNVLTILFLRRSSTPNVPYVTIEMRGNQIQQIHGYGNDIGKGAKNPRLVHNSFLSVWLAWLRRGSPRNEDGTPKISRRKKEEKTA